MWVTPHVDYEEILTVAMRTRPISGMSQRPMEDCQAHRAKSGLTGGLRM